MATRFYVGLSFNLTPEFMSACYLLLHSCGAVCWIFVYSIRFEVRMGTENVRQKSLLGLWRNYSQQAIRRTYITFRVGSEVFYQKFPSGTRLERSTFIAQRSTFR